MSVVIGENMRAWFREGWTFGTEGIFDVGHVVMGQYRSVAGPGQQVEWNGGNHGQEANRSQAAAWFGVALETDRRLVLHAAPDKKANAAVR